MNADLDTLFHIPRKEQDQHIKADSSHALISHVVQGTTLIEAYYCNIQVTETLDKQPDPKAMSLRDCILVQCQDPAIRKIKYHISKNKLRMHKVHMQDT